jgi:hypothetical protein
MTEQQKELIKNNLPAEDYEKIKFVIYYYYESQTAYLIPSTYLPDKEVCKALIKIEQELFIADKENKLLKCRVYDFQTEEIVCNYLDRELL